MTHSAKSATIAAGAIVAASILLLFFGMPYASGYGGVRVSVAVTLRDMWSLEEWQHCWMVPFASAVIVWLDRKKLAGLPIRGAGSGLFLLVLGMLFYWTGYRTENITISFFAAQILLAGLIVWLLGWRWMKALAFPWAFLVFMWPLLFMDNMVAFPLRLIMAKSSVAALNILGIPAVQVGSGILSAPNAMTGLVEGKKFSVDVADPCSGIRSLFALTMVTALYAYFTMQTWWQKWLLFLSAAPLAIFGNLCRIIALVFGVMALGSQTAIGSLEQPSFFHEAAGYLVFIVAMLGMVGFGAALLKIPSIKFNFGSGNGGPPASSPRARPPGKYEDPY